VAHLSNLDLADFVHPGSEQRAPPP